RHRNPPIPHQPDRLDLELPAELPSLHHHSPAPKTPYLGVHKTGCRPTVAFFWWWQFKLQALQEWTFGTYIFVLAYACLMYFQSTLLFPRDLGPDVDLDEFFHRQRGWFFGANVLNRSIDLVDTWLKGSEHFQSLGPEYPVSVAVNIIWSLIAIFVPSRIFQWVFALGSLLWLLSWVFRQFNTLG
ncbi:MAG: hypothetical protein O9269_00345, partial [Brevundimonas sp.]